MRQGLFDGKPISYYDVDVILKIENRDVYKLLPAAGAQQTMTVLGRDWKSWLTGCADFEKEPGKYKNRPRLPGYAGSAATYVVSRNGYKIKNGHLHLSGGRKFDFAPLKIVGCMDQPFNAKADVVTVGDVRIVPMGTSYVVELVHFVRQEDIATPPNSSNHFSIDLGIDNLLAITSSQPGIHPVLVKGGALKSINAKWNKDKAELAAGGKRKAYVERKEERKLKAELSKLYRAKLAEGCSPEEARKVFGPKVPRAPKPVTNKPKGEPVRNGASKARHIRSKSMKRENAMRDFMHKTSRWLIDECVKSDTGTIIIGWNKGWKNEIGIGAVNNQNFVGIPYRKLIRMIAYKAEAKGIVVVEREESYTSQASSIDLDSIPTYGKLPKDGPAPAFSGRRTNRGLYRSKDGATINADVNGSINIARKEVGDDWLKSHVRADEGLVGRPAVVRHIDRHLEGRHRPVEAASRSLAI